MNYQSVLDFGSSQPMAADIDNVIHAPGDLKVPIAVPDGPVTGEVEPVVRSVVSIQKPFVASVNRSGHPRPGLLHAQRSRNVVSRFLVSLITRIN